MLLAASPALAQEDYNFSRDIVGGKTDPTSRDSPYINDATTALDRSVERAQREKTPVKHVRPEHRVILRNIHGRQVPTDIYVIPPSPAENGPIY
jgi:hypothetical protein